MNFVITFLVSIGLNLFSGVERVEPPCWWVGMNTPLTLMVYSNDISDAHVVVNSEDIVVKALHNGDSPNYLFIDLELKSSLKEGQYRFTMTDKKGGKRKFDYTFHKRREGSAQRNGFGREDVVYLLMADRFSNGNKKNDSSKLMNEVANRSDVGGRHGGDLEGIMNHLDYFAELGVTTIWPTPILVDNEFKASYHGYACGDYYRVDPRFGTNEYYKSLVATAHAKGLKFIQDMVPNHCGTEHWWMKDLPFKDWINQFDKYTNSNFAMSTHADPHASEYDKNLCVTGWFDTTMPDMNFKNPFLLQYFKQNAVWWVEFADLDGIRVDTYPYGNKEKTEEWTASILKEYPNLTIMGECWFHSALELAYWEGDGETNSLPMIMDFVLQDNIPLAFKENDAVPMWDRGIKRIYNALSHDFAYKRAENLLIFMSNHDTPRAAYSLGGTDVSEDLLAQRMINATTLILTTRGIPQLYTGDEIMLRSEDGTSGHVQERRDFPGGWKGDKRNAFTTEGRTEQENALFNHTKSLLQWRKGSKAITYGALKHFLPNSSSNCYVYFRYTDDELVMVVINNGVAPYHLVWDQYREVLPVDGVVMNNVINGEQIKVGEQFTQPPLSSAVFVVSK